MITGIILLVLTLISIYIIKKSHDYEMIGFFMVLIFGVWLFIHIICISITGYNYNMFVERRNAFEQTLNNSRKGNNQYESAAIVSVVANWNITLATEKYNNKNWYLDQFIDDRIETLEPIK